MVSKGKASSKRPGAGDARSLKLFRQLTYLGAALREEAAKAEQHGTDGRLEMISLAGWTIYAAYRAGLLNALQGWEKIEEDLGESLKNGISKWFPEAGQQVPRGPTESDSQNTGGTIGDFLQRTERRLTEGKLLAEINNLIARLEDRPLPVIPLDPEWAAEALVSRIWQTLTPDRPDNLPPAVAHAYAMETAVGSPLLAPGYIPFIAAAWVVETIAQVIARKGLPDTGEMLTISKAHELTGVNKGTISRLCDAGTIATNGLKERKRRLSTASLLAYMADRDKKRPEPVLSAKSPGESSWTSESERPQQQAARRTWASTELTWSCKKCGHTFANSHDDAKCPKCGSDAIAPIPPRRA